ncbi:MAG: type I methionyl aminopeptidase [Clostridiales bacterium]|jgi:methionyl aminopeptidase|nr:type I methionyl aminopeptidase [Clostridiales bacterium]HOA33490.1 type I methionyl aminopeptidase [Clostridiales bacterium]HPU67586.1 type I methionyl aminopeptidase [Clostridiales bacterium]HQA05890.1 type I methionyl aminopeptidase [Clostridiales bacterium]HQD72191.1 type I methionyl aminopeptidase [Clostridiales bacterium]
MIMLKSRRELEIMREAGRISARALQLAGEVIAPGISTADIDREVRKFIESQGAVPSFLGYNGFPAAACISVNNEVIHGIPGKDRIIKEGDLVSVDLGASIDGYHGDNAATFAVGKISPAAQRLMDTTREALYEGLKKAVAGGRIGDIGHAIESYCVSRGYGIVREYTGHGIGRSLHEDPSVPNYGSPGKGTRLLQGMTLAIEPMINEGTGRIKLLGDGWTVVTADGKLSAHFEHTIAITDGECLILTTP